MENRVVPRRKVPARVRLADATVFEGALYAPIERDEGVRARVVDRLNAPEEKYLPLAIDDQHLLVNKAGIVTVEIEGSDGEAEAIPSEEAKELRLQLRLVDGTILHGRTYAELPSERARVLDFMNVAAPKFITLLREDRTLIVNESFVVAIAEEPARGVPLDA